VRRNRKEFIIVQHTCVNNSISTCHRSYDKRAIEKS
jgi:hypothetical protein